MRIALFQPDIPQNAGAMIRLAACLGAGVDIIEPCGFVWSEPKMRRAGMDYLDRADIVKHISWNNFLAANAAKGAKRSRIVLLTTRADMSHLDTAFQADDILLLGRESAGVPDEVHEAVDLRIKIPIRADMRSLNIATAASIVLGEALRQTGGFPPV